VTFRWTLLPIFYLQGASIFLSTKIVQCVCKDELAEFPPEIVQNGS
jgi:hypothetical protein